MAVWHNLPAAGCRVWAQAVDTLGRLLLPEDRWSDSPAHPTVYKVCGALGLTEPRALLSQLRILHILRVVVCNADVLWDRLIEESAAGGFFLAERPSRRFALARLLGKCSLYSAFA